MVIDTSAIVAILQEEPETGHFLARLEVDPTRLMSATSYLEATIIIEDRFGYDGIRDLKLFLHEAGIEIEPVTFDQAELAREAYRRFGRGNHPAALNYGDCFAYALAKAVGEPLLFKGDDFSRTDLVPAA
jgi:ribonuclease VapC